MRYEYRCLDCSATTEHVQSIHDEPHTECDDVFAGCTKHGGKIVRVMQSANVSWGGRSPGLENFWASGDPADIGK